MRGRLWFRMAKPLFRVAISFQRLFPDKLIDLWLVVLRQVPTKLGLALRYVAVARLTAACGDNVAVYEGVYLKRLSKMTLGDHVSIHPMCYIDATGGLEIGSNVSIAHAVTIMTTEHDYQHLQCYTRDAPAIAAPVRIEGGVWIGAGARILSGVTIGKHAVVGAGAVVTRDVLPYTVVVGVPAHPVRVFEKELA